VTTVTSFVMLVLTMLTTVPIVLVSDLILMSHHAHAQAIIMTKLTTLVKNVTIPVKNVQNIHQHVLHVPIHHTEHLLMELAHVMVDTMTMVLLSVLNVISDV